VKPADKPDSVRELPFGDPCDRH